MKRLYAVFGALVLLAVLAVGVSAQSGSGGYLDVESNLRVWQETVFKGDVYARDDLTVTDQLVVNGDITLADDFAVTDVAALGTLKYTAGATQTVTADGPIAVTSSYVLLTASGSVGTSAVGTCNTLNQGQLLILENVSNTTITITDTGTLKLSGNLALAQWDSGALVCDGTNWAQLYEQDN